MAQSGEATPSAEASQTQGLRREIRVEGTRITLLGTAHVSAASVDDVTEAVASGDYDAVAVELCESRYRALTDPDALENMDLFQVIRQGQAGMVAANLALGAYQQRLADQFGIRPGAEMAAAIEGAREADLDVFRIDREIGTTLKRIYRRTPWWQRAVLLSGLVNSTFISRDSISEDEIERLKEGDVLESTFAEFAERSATLYECLISERDQYMAARLVTLVREHQPDHIVAVIGAGHMAGAEAALAEPPSDPAAICRQLDELPPRNRWLAWLPWGIVALILAGFVWGFFQDVDKGLELITAWVVINGSLTALGALAAAAHPLTIVTAFVSAPLTSLNPTIGAGFVAAGAELALRKPRVGHFRSLRADVKNLGGWWRNRVARTLLVFVFTTLGSAAGTYIGGFHVLERVLG
jgi:pheromone shutdown-related protein TraB